MGFVTYTSTLSRPAPYFYSKTQADNKFLTQSSAQFLPLSGGTITEDLTVEGTLSTPNNIDVGRALFQIDGDIKGEVWEEWGSA